MRNRAVALAALATVAAGVGCAPVTVKGLPPVPPPGPVAIAAPVARTWDATVETVVSGWQMTPEQVQRESGLLTTTTMTLDGWSMAQRLSVADHCGAGAGQTPTYVRLVVLVRGDSTRSTLELTPRFLGKEGAECTSTGQWEHAIATAVKAKAEQAKAAPTK